MTITVAQFVANQLAELGATHVFTLTGGGAMFLNDAFGYHPRIKAIYHHHEQAAAMAAEGYARSTVRSCHVLTCRVLEQARRSGWVPVNVARDARPPRQSTSNPSAGADRDCQGHGRGGGHVEPNLATLLVLAADTGARWGELCALRWRHLDEQAGTIRIEAANR